MKLGSCQIVKTRERREKFLTSGGGNAYIIYTIGGGGVVSHWNTGNKIANY